MKMLLAVQEAMDKRPETLGAVQGSTGLEMR